MPDFELVREVDVGDLLTAGSVLLATATLLYTLFKDRSMKQREYADRIRQSAAATLTAIERWKEIALRYFQDAQSLLTDADILLVKDQDVTSTRDFLWRSLVALEAQTTARVLSEKLEGSYAGLYGYDPTIHDAYTSATSKMRDAFESAHAEHLKVTQSRVLEMDSFSRPYQSAELGNRLRASTRDAKQAYSARANEAISPLRQRLLGLVESGDDIIYRKCTVLPKQSSAQ